MNRQLQRAIEALESHGFGWLAVMRIQVLLQRKMSKAEAAEVLASIAEAAKEGEQSELCW